MNFNQSKRNESRRAAMSRAALHLVARSHNELHGATMSCTEPQ